MATVFIYDLAANVWEMSKLKAEDQKLFVNRKYERLGQQKRIKSLVRMGAIPKKFEELLETVRKIRNEYLHLLEKDYSKIEDDAFESYEASFHVVKSLVAIPLADKGKFQIPTHLERFLQLKGITECSGS